MTRDHRFASLKGHSRRWLTQDEYDLAAELSSGREEAIDEPIAPASAHDGGTAVAPTREPLARLGDVLSF